MIKEVIISRYNEDISWVLNINPEIKIYLYNKGEYINYKNQILLPNIGREAHTYLYHICSNYNNLSDFIFFFQGYPFDHTGDCIDIINGNQEVWNSKVQLYYEEYWGYAHNSIGTMWPLCSSSDFKGYCLLSELNGLPYHPNLPVEELWKMIFITPPPSQIEFTPGNQFNISKTLILNRSLEFWKYLLTISESRDTFPWEFERIMPYILNPNYLTIK
jgi:hypothetical protein